MSKPKSLAFKDWWRWCRQCEEEQVAWLRDVKHEPPELVDVYKAGLAHGLREALALLKLHGHVVVSY